MAAYGMHFLKCQLSMAFLTSISSGSFSEASSTSLVVMAVGVALMATNLTNSSDSCECFSLIAVLPRSLDRGSAIFSFPETDNLEVIWLET